MTQQEGKPDILESKIRQLEKAQEALITALFRSNSVQVPDPIDGFAVPHNYFASRRRLLQSIDETHGLFTKTARVVELDCGAGRSAEYLVGKVARYIGFDPSPIIVELARKTFRNRHVSFEVFSKQAVENHRAKADLVVLFFNKGTWSIRDANSLLKHCKTLLVSKGRLLLGFPYSFSDLKEAGWGIRNALESAGYDSNGLILDSATPEEPSYYMIVSKLGE